MIESTIALSRRAIRELKPYTSARSLMSGKKIFLDANECPWAPFPQNEEVEGINRYPDPQPEELLQRLSELYDVSTDCLMVGRGTDDAIDAIVRTFCEAGVDEILVCPPTYGVYRVAAEIQGAKTLSVPLKREEGFQLDPEGILSAKSPKTKVVFLCSPNNPTGSVLDKKSVLNLCESLQGKAIVVVDEAYIEFSTESSFTQYLKETPNLLVLRTLSKAFALAGARCGVVIAHRDIISLLQKVRAPYPLSAPSVSVVLRTLSSEGIKLSQTVISRLKEERQRLITVFEELPQVEKVFPSQANFLLLKVKDSDAFFKLCLSKGIVVRDRSNQLGLNNCVRISVGSPEENKQLVKVLKESGIENGA